MQFAIPAKTFLIGEYAVLKQAGAIILITTPCFKLSVTETKQLEGIHPDSPAGKFWHDFLPQHGLSWFDPYEARGGFGASSAQFLGAYLAYCRLNSKSQSVPELLQYYAAYAWDGKGVKPSGYDIQAQAGSGCVYINHQVQCETRFTWPFPDIGFILIHTGKKLATHEHLHHLSLPNNLELLATLAASARSAFDEVDSERLIAAVNGYYHQLVSANLVAAHSHEAISRLQKNPDILAIKGCGAMGADVLLLLVRKEKQAEIMDSLASTGWFVAATQRRLSSQRALI